MKNDAFFKLALAAILAGVIAAFVSPTSASPSHSSTHVTRVEAAPASHAGATE